mmetsp:Transcript_110308/g.235614  ORF Transcript_110308/g.235614 Transcript_110308/m.235614 type:complete len:204 (+) Transcript_110308:273-884(+)
MVVAALRGVSCSQLPAPASHLGIHRWGRPKRWRSPRGLPAEPDPAAVVAAIATHPAPRALRAGHVGMTTSARGRAVASARLATSCRGAVWVMPVVLAVTATLAALAALVALVVFAALATWPAPTALAVVVALAAVVALMALMAPAMLIALATLLVRNLALAKSMGLPEVCRQAPIWMRAVRMCMRRVIRTQSVILPCRMTKLA